MQHELFLESDFVLKVFDSFPSALFIVDADVRIYHLNSAAASTFALDFEKVYLQRGGEVLHCLHSTENPAGCGFADFCKDCLIRNLVRSALENNKMYREKTRMEMLDDGKKSEIDLIVTASPFEYKEKHYTILILEDVSELNQLRGLLPICSNCKNIRNDDQYWESVEKYFSKHHDVRFTHGICPKCAQELYSFPGKE
jgi:hypothetical protein